MDNYRFNIPFNEQAKRAYLYHPYGLACFLVLNLACEAFYQGHPIWAGLEALCVPLWAYTGWRNAYNELVKERLLLMARDIIAQLPEGQGHDVK